MNLLADLLPALVTLLPVVVIVLVVSFFSRRAAKNVAIVFGIILSLLLILEMVVALRRSSSSNLDTSEQGTVQQAAERDFRSNFVSIEVPEKPAPPFTKAEYVIVVNNYENQEKVDNFIYDACGKLDNKSTNLKVQPRNESASQPKLIDRACTAL